MRDINDIDPLPKLGALVVREPVAEPAKPIDTRWAESDFRATTTTIEREGSYTVTRRWYDGRLISSMYERATPEDDAHLERFSSFIVGSTEPMPSGVVESPAAVLSQAEVKALAESAAYLQRPGDPKMTSLQYSFTVSGDPAMAQRAAEQMRESVLRMLDEDDGFIG
jgi:hypothetical protein